MISHRRKTRSCALAFAGAVVAGALSVAPANAETQDEAYIKAVDSLGIEFAEGSDLVAMGHGLCDNLSSSMTSGFRNPVTSVRNVLTALESGGMSTSQAVAVMQVSVAYYCPEYRAFMPR